MGEESKILIIGQALPAVKQIYPYDTTYWYDWLKDCNITKEESLDIFEYDAVFGEFPGFSPLGGHLKPTEEQMEQYYQSVLKAKIDTSKLIIILGGVAKEFLKDKLKDKIVFYIVHPSKRNTLLIKKQWKEIVDTIKFVVATNNQGTFKIKYR